MYNTCAFTYSGITKDEKAIDLSPEEPASHRAKIATSCLMCGPQVFRENICRNIYIHVASWVTPPQRILFLGFVLDAHRDHRHHQYVVVLKYVHCIIAVSFKEPSFCSASFSSHVYCTSMVWYLVRLARHHTLYQLRHRVFEKR